MKLTNPNSISKQNFLSREQNILFLYNICIASTAHFCQITASRPINISCYASPVRLYSSFYFVLFVCLFVFNFTPTCRIYYSKIHFRPTQSPCIDAYQVVGFSSRLSNHKSSSTNRVEIRKPQHMLGTFLWCCAEIAENILARTKFKTRGIKHGQLSRFTVSIFYSSLP